MSLLAPCDAQSFHLAIQVAALEPQDLRGPAHVAVVLFEFAHDVIALVSGPSFLEAGESASGRPGGNGGGLGAAVVLVQVGRQMAALDAVASGHDHQPLYEGLELPDV